jgi:hypothetical protein
MHIELEDPDKLARGWNTYLLPLHGIGERELSVVFRSAVHHFEGGHSANLFFMGQLDIPGIWAGLGDVACVSSYVVVIQFECRMLKANFERYISNWLKKQYIPEQVIDKVARRSRVFTTHLCEAMGIRYESPVEIDAGVRNDFERLRQLARPENEQESQELLQLLGKCTDWMEDNDLPDEVFDLPAEKLIDAVTHYSTSRGTSAPRLTDALMVVDRNLVQICDTRPTSMPVDKLIEVVASASPVDELEVGGNIVQSDNHTAGPPTIYGPPASTDHPEDSCDELERELVAANQAVVPTNSAEQFRLQRRVHEPVGYMLYKTSVGLPVLTAHRPMHKLSTDDVAEILVTRFRQKHGETEPGSFKDAMLQITGCLQDAIREGRVAQKDRLSVILPPLTAAYKKLFNRKAASLNDEVKGEISRVLLRSRCKNCDQSFVPSDTSLYGSDAAGVEVVVGQRSYNSREFCGERCEQRWHCFRCQCGRPLQKGRLGWLTPRCSMCGVGRPVYGRVEMDNILSGLDRHHHVRQFYPRF